MADIAYERLAEALQNIAASTVKPSTRDIGAAMADAWSIVDSVHRFHDLVMNMPGLSNSPWRKLLGNRLTDVVELRNSIQHQLGEMNHLLTSGNQIWGYLSWAE